MEAMVEVLLVEDNPDDVEMAVAALRKHKITNPILAARDGEQALAAIFGDGNPGPGGVRLPMVILLDLNLPKISGLEVLRRLRADARTRAIPVVVLTVAHDGQSVAAADALGVATYMTKPIDFPQFVRAAKHFGLRWAVCAEPPRFPPQAVADRAGLSYHPFHLERRGKGMPLSAGPVS